MWLCVVWMFSTCYFTLLCKNVTEIAECGNINFWTNFPKIWKTASVVSPRPLLIQLSVIPSTRGDSVGAKAHDRRPSKQGPFKGEECVGMERTLAPLWKKERDTWWFSMTVRTRNNVNDINGSRSFRPCGSCQAGNWTCSRPSSSKFLTSSNHDKLGSGVTFSIWNVRTLLKTAKLELLRKIAEKWKM